MRIFISYSASDASEAHLMASALQARGYNVFFDKENLGAGQSYDGKIERAVHSADLFIFLLSPEAIEPGRYTMSELGYAQQRWPNPDRYILPVMVRAVDLNNVPDYLRAVSFLKPSGNLVAEVGSAVDQMLARSVAWSIARRFAFYGAFAGLVASFLAFQNQLSLIGVDVLGVPPDCGLPIPDGLSAALIPRHCAVAHAGVFRPRYRRRADCSAYPASLRRRFDALSRSSFGEAKPLGHGFGRSGLGVTTKVSARLERQRAP
jgi:hypothetical protein